MYSTGMSTFDFVLYFSFIMLCFGIRIYRGRVKEQKSEIHQLKAENEKLKEAVRFYHEQRE
ncbi:hypothetical protein [Guptibacillus hwajinpoensis]|uniref:hypothetical protein n=1 Tax=Guptibacillus hwajinpoensis TaxID=208199 RepID=UPI001CFCDAE4|nr:hypothetical protein [Pseudalkalibacillus hwajinpoensis]WLR59027.1 hypothetical protein LC071_18025 [Pseudalkalibacillus hwajinpoensis]